MGVMVFLCGSEPKKNREAFRRWRFSLDSGVCLAGPVRQQAGEIEVKAKVKTGEPALHGGGLNHSAPLFGKSALIWATGSSACTGRARSSRRSPRSSPPRPTPG